MVLQGLKKQEESLEDLGVIDQYQMGLIYKEWILEILKEMSRLLMGNGKLWMKKLQNRVKK